MFGGMAICTVRPGQMGALVAAALDHASALKRQPGYRASYVLSERDGPTQVSLSLFDSPENFHRALESTRAVIAGHHIERLLDGPPTFRLFDVREPP